MSVDQARQERQQAAQDEADIIALEKFEPFQRYWNRRLRQKYEQLVEDLKHGEMGGVERENVRQKMLLLEDIMGMSRSDRIAASRVVDDLQGAVQAVQPRPVQVG